MVMANAITVPGGLQMTISKMWLWEIPYLYWGFANNYRIDAVMANTILVSSGLQTAIR